MPTDVESGWADERPALPGGAGGGSDGACHGGVGDGPGEAGRLPDFRE